MYKSLPHDTSWFYLRNLPPETTEEELQELILNRTGIEIPLDQVAVNYQDRFGKCSGVVCMSPREVLQLVNWAIGDDNLHGARLHFNVRG